MFILLRRFTKEVQRGMIGKIKRYLKNKITRYETMLEEVQEIILMSSEKNETLEKKARELYLRDDECLELLRAIIHIEERNKKE